MEVIVKIESPDIVSAIREYSEATKMMLTALASAVSNHVSAAVIEETAPEKQPLQVGEVSYDTFTPTTQPVQNTAAEQVSPAPQTTIPAPAPAPVQPTVEAPTSIDPAYRGRVCTAAAKLVEKGKMPDILAILNSFGVSAVTQLSATQLPAFAEKITAIGAVI